MIERLLAAERALEADQLELADRLFAQVAAADPRNAIAMTGRAKVARRQGDIEAARRHAARALETDPDDRVAQTLASEVAAPPPMVPPRADRAAPRASASPPRRPGLLRWLRRLLGRD